MQASNLTEIQYNLNWPLSESTRISHILQSLKKPNINIRTARKIR